MIGREKELMSFFLKQIKQTLGLTTTIEKIGGINGKWLTPDMPYELNNTKISRVMLIKALFLTEDEFIKQALAFRAFALEFGEKHGITLDREREPRKKSKQS